MKVNRIFLSLLLLVYSLLVSAQAPRQYSSSEILHRLEKLGILGNALYVAAHPDDENTRMITYLANDRLVNAAYLSMTRGDGGQNLIGPEIREQLGIIRTQELLAARRIDDGKQFFTRAIDFGYSKNTEETQKIWDRDEVLKDVVWTFRKFRPDVVITRFPPDGRGGHGHHTTSSILAEEAFKISGDPNVYPEQLKFVEPWSPRRLLTNTGRWWNTNISDEQEGVISVNIGRYNALLGKSYSEIASTSRSQHKSQGFGSTGSRGDEKEYLEYRLGSKTEGDLFEGIDITWNRVKGGEKISRSITELVEKYDAEKPFTIISDLLAIRKDISNLDDVFWKGKKLHEVDELIKSCAGLYLEVKASQYSAVPGETIDLNIEVVNRSPQIMQLKRIEIKKAEFEKDYGFDLLNNLEQDIKEKIKIKTTEKYSNPYWLNNTGSLGMYKVDDPTLIGKPENDPVLLTTFTILINGTEISFDSPIVYKWNDPVKGEQYRPFIIEPPALVSIKDKVVIFPSDTPKDVVVEVTAGKDDISGRVSLVLPEGWKSDPETFDLTIQSKDETKAVVFTVTPPKNDNNIEINAQFEMDGYFYDKSKITITYDHFPTQTLFPKASAKFVRLNISKKGEVIGYIMGAGDEVPQSLEQIGYRVWVMNDEDITADNLSTLDAVIMGVRVLNTDKDLINYYPVLLDYVRKGGTLIYQYNTGRNLKWEEFAPFELNFSGNSSASRVSVEEAPVTVLLPDHPVMQKPNKITSDDFEGWVQERGLYFPNKWAPNYEAILSSHDPDQEPLNGGLLVAKEGNGYFVYTGYSWFRQLPAGVPGAYRLFANIISLGNDISSDVSDLNIKD